MGDGSKIKSSEIWHDEKNLDELLDGFRNEISSGKNLNDFKLSGVFCVSQSATTASLLNCPVSSAFIMEIMVSYFIKQVITTYKNNACWSRVYYPYGDDWSDWKQIY